MTDFHVLCLGGATLLTTFAPPAQPANDNRRGQDGAEHPARSRPFLRLRWVAPGARRAERRPSETEPTVR